MVNMLELSGRHDQVDKRNDSGGDVIFIDGLWKSGKSLLSPIISGMDNVEQVKIEYALEFIAQLNELGEVSDQAALTFLKTYTDILHFHSVVGREVNLRWNDDTGFRTNPRKWQTLKRLFAPANDVQFKTIEKNNIALCLMSHMMLLASGKLTQAFGNRLKFIEVVRHPVDLVDGWHEYLQAFDSPREFTLSFFRGDDKLPWFAAGEAGIVDTDPNDLNRAVLCLCSAYDRLFDRAEEVIGNVDQYLFVDFDDLAENPAKVMLSLEQFLKRNLSSRNTTILKSLNLPRCSVHGVPTRMDRREWPVFASDCRSRQTDRLSIQLSPHARDRFISIVDRFISWRASLADIHCND